MEVNIIWENKGILLGIMLYLLNNYHKLVKKRIIVHNGKIRVILKKLFTDFSFKKRGNGFVISIKSSKEGNLIINNLNNLSIIAAKKVRLLPWYDKDNPIVMFRQKDGREYDIIKLKDTIKEFSKGERFLIYDQINFIEGMCNLRIWDTFMEHKILIAYINRYKADIRHIYYFINKELGGLYCAAPRYKAVPVYIRQPVMVPSEPVVIRAPVEVAVKEKCDYGNYNQLIGLVTNKIKSVNSIIDV